MNCPICNKSGRRDNIVRHITTHKNQICTLMCAQNIHKCIESKMPLLFVPKKVLYCLICRKIATTPIGINSMMETYTALHKDCCSAFDTVKKHYVGIESKNILIMDPPTTPTPPPAAADADVAALKKRIADLEDDLEESEALAKDTYDESVIDCRRKNYAVDLLDQIKSVARRIMTDDQISTHGELFEKIQRVCDEEWDD